MLKFVIACVIAIVFFFSGVSVAANDLANDPPPKPRIVTKTVTKTVAKTPSACRDMVYYGDQIRRAANDIDTAASSQLDAVSAARAAIAGKYVNDLNDVSGDLIKIQTRTLDAVQTIANSQLPYDTAKAKCLGGGQ